MHHGHVQCKASGDATMVCRWELPILGYVVNIVGHVLYIDRCFLLHGSAVDPYLRDVGKPLLATLRAGGDCTAGEHRHSGTSHDMLHHEHHERLLIRTTLLKG